MLKRMLKNERGLTLIELLVVVVILGIVVAIAVPTVGDIIENSKLDAHIANAQQMVAAYKMYAAATPDAEKTAKLEDIAKAGFLEAKIKDPHGGKDEATRYYDAVNSAVSYDATNNTYTVTLKGSGTDAKTYVNGDPSNPSQVSRDTIRNVLNPTTP